MDFLVKFAEGFIGMFQKGGENFIDMFAGIIPTRIYLILAVKALIKIIGEELSEKTGLTALRGKQREILFCDKQ